MRKIDVTDLLGGQYAAGTRDCLWAVRRGAERIFQDLGPEELPLDDAAFAARAAMDAGAHRWKPLGPSRALATRLGDIVSSLHEGVVGVSILIDEAGGVVLTALPRRGVCTLSIRGLVGVDGVYRRSPS